MWLVPVVTSVQSLVVPNCLNSESVKLAVRPEHHTLPASAMPQVPQSPRLEPGPGPYRPRNLTWSEFVGEVAGSQRSARDGPSTR